MKEKNIIKNINKNIICTAVVFVLAGILSSIVPKAAAGHIISQYSIDENEGDDDTDIDDYYESPSLNVNSVNLIAGGNDYKLKLEHALQAEYTITEGSESVSLADMTAQSVTITPLAAGQAAITVTAVGYDNTVSTLQCQIQVSELSLSTQHVEIYLNDEDRSADASVQGADFDAVYYGSGDEDESLREELYYGTNCSITAGNPSVAGAYFQDHKIHIYGFGKGVTNINVNIYGKALKIKVKVYYSTLNKYVINTYKGCAKKTLKVSGAGSRKVTWTTGNKKVASVSQKGVVTFKNVGTTKITAKVGTSRLLCIVSVSSKTAYKVTKKARSISNDKNVHYSQPLRMSPNYYDCSSLVWRCYKPYGITFGSADYAPVASAEGRWCTNTKCVIAKKPVDIMSLKLVPGDTIYYSYNENNGQYLNIDHAAIFGGYAYDEWGGYYGTVLEASSSNNSVVERRYYAGNSIKLIGRPSSK